MLKLIQAISKKDQVVAAIKEAILSGAYRTRRSDRGEPDGAAIGQRIPLVREALIALEHQGL